MAIWMLMAFQAGVLNMGGFLACHRFVSHVTGFATHFGYEFSQWDLLGALGMVVVPFFFLVGCMISGLLVDSRIRHQRRPQYHLTFGLIFLILVIVYLAGFLGLFGQFGEPTRYSRDYVLLSLLCLVCGIQNGTITTVSRSVIRTTHLTGVTTDLGLGLVRLISGDSGPDRNEVAANLMRSGIIGSFILGSVFGAYGYKHFQWGGFLLSVFTSGSLFCAMLYLRLRRDVKTSAPNKISTKP